MKKTIILTLFCCVISCVKKQESVKLSFHRKEISPNSEIVLNDKIIGKIKKVLVKNSKNSLIEYELSEPISKEAHFLLIKNNGKYDIKVFPAKIVESTPENYVYEVWDTIITETDRKNTNEVILKKFLKKHVDSISK